MKQIKKQIRNLGYYQIAGGTLGLSSIIFIVYQTGFSYLLTFLFIGLPFVFSIYAGIQCCKFTERSLTLSKYNQFFQVVNFAIGSVTFKYFAGILLGIGLNLENGFFCYFNFGLSEVSFSYDSSVNHSMISINLVALYLLKRIIKLENEMSSLDYILDGDIKGQKWEEAILDENLLKPNQ